MEHYDHDHNDKLAEKQLLASKRLIRATNATNNCAFIQPHPLTTPRYTIVLYCVNYTCSGLLQVMHGCRIKICIVQVYGNCCTHVYKVIILYEVLYNPAITPPLSCMRALGKTGEGVYLRDRDINFTCDDHYRPTNATWARNPCTFSGSLIGKIREK